MSISEPRSEGFLGRYLRQRLLEVETHTRQHDGDMAAVVEWVAKVHARLNKVIEGHSSSDVTLGPADFLDCPVDDARRARAWFVELWNARLVSLVRDAVKEGLLVRIDCLLSIIKTTTNDLPKKVLCCSLTRTFSTSSLES